MICSSREGHPAGGALCSDFARFTGISARSDGGKILSEADAGRTPDLVYLQASAEFILPPSIGECRNTSEAGSQETECFPPDASLPSAINLSHCKTA